MPYVLHPIYFLVLRRYRQMLLIWFRKGILQFSVLTKTLKLCKNTPSHVQTLSLSPSPPCPPVAAGENWRDKKQRSLVEIRTVNQKQQ